MKKKILITAKTYPSISIKYDETVCTAGIELDEQSQPINWIRVYPVPYRYVENEKRFPLYSTIEAEVIKDKNDVRKESHKILNNDYRIIHPKIDTKDNWKKRKELVLDLKAKSIEEIIKNGASLGIIKPLEIVKAFYEESERDWTDKQNAVLQQLNLFKVKKDLDKIPYNFLYRFKCDDPECKTTHSMSVIDWGLNELYRKMLQKAPYRSQIDREKYAIDMVIQKMETEMKKDLHLIVGNQKLWHKVFMIIGLFYPKKES